MFQGFGQDSISVRISAKLGGFVLRSGENHMVGCHCSAARLFRNPTSPENVFTRKPKTDLLLIT